MDFISTLSAWQWAVLAAVPPAIIALYFLKLKRQPLEVPSTYLWHKSIEDLRVNSLWQRMRSSLLLFLQLLLVALAAIALLRPGWRGSTLEGDRFVFLLDNSASMGATDVEQGSSPTRLEEAKRRIAELIDDMKSGDAAQLISFSDVDGTRVEQPFTQSRRELRRALDAVRQTSRTTSLDQALRLAAGLANPGRSGERGGPDVPVADALPAELFIFSDGKFPDVHGFSLGNLTPTFVPLGRSDTANIGIVAFTVRRNDDKPDQLQAFGQLENFGAADVTVQVELYLNGELLDANRVLVPKAAAAGVAFDLGDIDAGALALRIPQRDALPADNEAFAVINRPHRAKVLFVTPGNEPLRRALSTEAAAKLAEVSLAAPDILATAEYQKAAAAGDYDLVIYDGCRPQQMPQANTLFIGRLPPIDAWSAGVKIRLPQVIDTDRRHPITQSLELGDVIIDQATPLKPPPGATRLIDSTRGVLLAIAPREGFEDAVLGFELFAANEQGETVANTNWSIKLSFSIFVYQAIGYLAGELASDEAIGRRPGQPVMLHASSRGERLTVRTPAGKHREVLRDRLGKFTFTEAEELGVYTVDDAGQPGEQFAVNLCDPAESDIRPRDTNSIQIGYTPVAGTTSWQPARQETWKWFVLFALGVLLVEWYIYNRRVYL